jgi:hypothetical protein
MSRSARKWGDRDALVDELWSVIETLPEPQSEEKRPSKQDAVIAMLRRPEGATVAEVASATGWQRHTVRPRKPHCHHGNPDQQGIWPIDWIVKKGGCGIERRTAGRPDQQRLLSP